MEGGGHGVGGVGWQEAGGNYYYSRSPQPVCLELLVSTEVWQSNCETPRKK